MVIYYPKLSKQISKLALEALSNSINLVKDTAMVYCPVETGQLFQAIEGQIDPQNAVGRVGIFNNEVATIGLYTEYGTGKRGLESWRQYFSENMPNFTIPIKPIPPTQAMHWVNEGGENIFIKRSWGQKGQAWLRRAVFDNENHIKKIFRKSIKGKLTSNSKINIGVSIAQISNPEK
jgi:hypothetical protein